MVNEMKSTHPVAPRSRWPFTRRQIVAQVIVAAVILASGIGIGIGGTILSLKDRIMWRPPEPPGRGEGIKGRFGPDAIIEEWKTEYGLTDEQAQQAKDTLTSQFEATRAIWLEFAERNKAEREKFIEAMGGVLTPEQFGRWEPEFRRRTEHFDRWRPGGPGGPRGDRRGPEGPNRPDGDRRRGPRGMRPPGPPPEPPPE